MIGKTMIDIERILLELEMLPKYKNQIMLQTYEGNEDPFDGTGALPALIRPANLPSGGWSETVYNLPLFDLPYTNSIISDLGMFRTRVMMMKPHRCYSYHKDPTPRIHIPLITDEKCMLIVDDKVIRLPADGNYYKIDTTLYHTALNGSNIERIHLVGGYHE